MRRFRPLTPILRTIGKMARLRLNGFWRAYEPDLSHWVTDLSSCDLFHGLVVDGEYLVTDDGYARLDAARLPLGHDPDAIAWTSTTATYGSGVAPAVLSGDNDVAQPVVGIYRFSRLTSSTQTLETVALTANTNTFAAPGGAGIYTESMHMFRIGNAVATWTPVQYRASLAVGGLMTTSEPPLATTVNLPDAAVFAAGKPEIQFTPSITNSNVAIRGVLHRIRGIA